MLPLPGMRFLPLLPIRGAKSHKSHDEMLVSKRPSQTPFLYSHAGHSVIIGRGWGSGTAPAHSGRSIPAGPVPDRGASDIHSWRLLNTASTQVGADTPWPARGPRPQALFTRETLVLGAVRATGVWFLFVSAYDVPFIRGYYFVFTI